MPTITIPHFNLAEPESSSSWPTPVCNEIRVPISNDSSATALLNLGFSRGNAIRTGGLPVKKTVVVAPNEVPKTDKSEQSKPIVRMPSAGETQREADLKLDQLENAIAPQPTEAIARLTDCILERFPIAGPTIIMFAGTQSNPLTSATCANVANSLARKTAGKILLVDSCPRRELTQLYHAAENRGLSNLLTDHSDWRSAVLKRSLTGLDFLPAGNSHWEHWGAENGLRHLAAELRREYPFVCVAVDDPQQSISRVWTGICDGSFLLVSQRNANPAIAESTVVEMQSSGARLLGCVVTDADSMQS